MKIHVIKMLNEAYLLFTILIVFHPDPWEPWHICPDWTWLQNFYQVEFRLMCSQPLSLSHYLKSAPSQVLLLWSDTCHSSELSSSTSVAFTSVLEILRRPVWSTSWMSVQPPANSVCHFLSLCCHYAIIIHLHQLLANLSGGNFFLFFTLKPLVNWTQLHISMPHEQHLTAASSVAF